MLRWFYTPTQEAVKMFSNSDYAKAGRMTREEAVSVYVFASTGDLGRDSAAQARMQRAAEALYETGSDADAELAGVLWDRLEQMR